MGRATQGVKLINIKGNDSIAAVTKVMKDDVSEVVLDEDGNIIEGEVIERVKPVLEILEDEGSTDDDDDDYTEEEEIDDEESVDEDDE
jgi:DNA gyrase subunit A